MISSSDAQAALPANVTLTNGVGTFIATLKTVGGETIKHVKIGWEAAPPLAALRQALNLEEPFR